MPLAWSVTSLSATTTLPSAEMEASAPDELGFVVQ